MSYFLISLLGLAFGSFINALVWRLHEQSKHTKPKAELSILKGRSMCPRCKHLLSAKDLVPVFSWLWLRGRCRYCRAKIEDSPWVELLTAALFGLSLSQWDFEQPFAELILGFWLIYLVLMIALMVYDLHWLTLPNKLIYLLLGLVTVQTLLISLLTEDVHYMYEAVTGLVVVGGIFAVLFYASGGRWLGGGDVKLAAFIGLLLGWQKGLIAVLVAAYAGSLVFGGLVLVKRYSLKHHFPFGPLLILGTLTAYFWGDKLINWYLGLSGF